VLGTFFSRQAASVLGKIAPARLVGRRPLGPRAVRDLLPVTHSIAETVGKAEAARLGFDEGYDGDRTVNFLKAVAARYARHQRDHQGPARRRAR
jgi:hypothetical protein